MSNFKVTEKAQRPANEKGKCSYCKSTIGDFHKDDCAFIKKKVKVKATIEYEVEVPNHWDEERVEFHRNDGTWCADNMIEELEEIIDGEDGCLCNCVEFEYIEDTSKAYLDE